MPERLDAYTADTYWLALHARAAGTPIGRLELVVTPSDEAGVATVLRAADAHRVPVVAWGGGSGMQGGLSPSAAASCSTSPASTASSTSTSAR